MHRNDLSTQEFLWIIFKIKESAFTQQLICLVFQAYGSFLMCHIVKNMACNSSWSKMLVITNTNYIIGVFLIKQLWAIRIFSIQGGDGNWIMFYIIYIYLCLYVYMYIYIYKYISFSDIKMQVALSESQEQNVYPEQQIWEGNDWYTGFIRLENCTSSTIG